MSAELEDLEKNPNIKEDKESEYLRVQRLKNNPKEMDKLDSKYLVDKPEKKKGSTKRTIMGFVPFIGSGMDIQESIKGKENFTDKKLNKKERVVKGVFGVGGAALDVVTLGADRLVLGVGERVAQVGVGKVARSEAKNVAERQGMKRMEIKDGKNFNKKGLIRKLGRFDIKDWLEKKKKLDKKRNMFENIWPEDNKKEEDKN
jgi:hypothetical protein